MEEKQQILLHSCCGPCSSSVLERLTQEYEVTLFYYNPNIAPEEEYRHRLETQKQLLADCPFAKDVRLIEGVYDPETFYRAAQGLENEPEGGSRCTECFRLRLRETARTAAENGIPLITTTLTVSPHKNAPLINELGEAIAAEYGVEWLHSDFKKKDGYLRSIRLSAEYGLYRQDYCGCVFSRRDRS